MLLEHTWRGLSGRRYDFQVHENQTHWPFWGGIYLFCSRDVAGWKVHYVGQTDNLSETLTPGRIRSLNASALSATHVHILLVSDTSKRKQMAGDLTAALHPECNSVRCPVDPLSQVA